MPTISEPLAAISSAKHARLRAAFIAGQIGQHTFRASLEILGLRGQDIDAEVALANTEKRQP